MESIPRIDQAGLERLLKIEAQLNNLRQKKSVHNKRWRQSKPEVQAHIKTYNQQYYLKRKEAAAAAKLAAAASS